MNYDLALPGPQYGVRGLLERAAKRMGRTLVPALETESFEMIRHYAAFGQTIGFQIPIGLNQLMRPDIACIPIDESDVPGGELLLGQLRGRALPVATLRFARQAAQNLAALPD